MKKRWYSILLLGLALLLVTSAIGCPEDGGNGGVNGDTSPSPAAFSVSNLSIESLEVAPNEIVTISVFVSNTGGTQGSYNVVLSINGVQEDTKAANVAAGGSVTVTFNAMMSDYGTYEVTIDDLSGSFTVIYEIPASFTTYTNQTNLFSISYPNDWEAPLYLLEDLEQIMEELVASIVSGAPVESYSMIFFAGLPTQLGWEPNVNIGVESFPISNITHELMVEAEIQGAKLVLTDYVEHNRIDTTINGRQVTILEWEGTFPGLGKIHSYQMLTLVGQVAWVVACAPPAGEMSEWEDIFEAIVRSLIIYT